MVLKITNLHILRYLSTYRLYLLERYTIDNQRCTHTASESAKTNGRLYRISVSGSGIGAWFPATGFYFGGNGNILQGELVDVGNKGAYWTSTASTYYVLYMWYDMNKIYLSGETYRSNSRPVRCIQE